MQVAFWKGGAKPLCQVAKGAFCIFAGVHGIENGRIQSRSYVSLPIIQGSAQIFKRVTPTAVNRIKATNLGRVEIFLQQLSPNIVFKTIIVCFFFKNTA